MLEAIHENDTSAATAWAVLYDKLLNLFDQIRTETSLRKMVSEQQSSLCRDSSMHACTG